MQILNNLPIGKRLAAGFAVVMLGIVLVGAAGLVALRSVQGEFLHLTKDFVPKVLQVQQVEQNLNITARAIRNIALLEDPAQRAAEKARIDASRKSNGEIYAKLEHEVTSAKGRELLVAAETIRARYNAALDMALEHFAAGRAAEGRNLLMGDLRKAQQAYFASVATFAKFQQELMEKSEEEVTHTLFLSNAVVYTVGGLAILLGMLLAWWIARSVTQPIAQAVRVADTIAAGDLTVQIDARGRDEAAHLLASMKRMNESLARIVGDVRHASDTIATGSSQIAGGTQDLSSRTEEQASNLQETAASMEQLSATMKQSADSAREASELAQSASGVATKGGQVVGEVVTTMEAITAQSRKIAEIINVIDGIAFQTNILALNASVEAARAGEQGRGFAVVASEVRNLAQRSAEAAREIKALINASVAQVESGGVLVHEAGRTMTEVVQQVRRVSDLIGEITAATREQTTGVVQVNEAVTQLDQVTQQNAALVEESAAAADSLKAEASRLSQAVAVFRVHGGPSGSFSAAS